MTPATSMLESIPYDLLEIIFHLACTDGGRTGCNLALVSKSIRSSSCASRFHSVSILSGISVQLTRLLHALDVAKADARAEGAPVPRVRHLCLYLTPAFRYPTVDVIDQDLAVMDHQRTLRNQLSEEAHTAIKKQIWEEYHREFRSLCSVVSADVETLCLLRHNYFLDQYFGRLPPLPQISCPGGFPRLREFAFNEALPPFVPAVDPGASTDGDRPPTGTPLFYPALRRLHMSVHTNTAVDFQWWAANAPHLAWLRISTSDASFPFDAPRFLPSLALVLDSVRLGDGERDAPFFSGLKTLMFMMHPIFGPDPSTETLAAYAAYTSALEHTLSEFGVPTTVFQPHYDGQDTARPFSLGSRQSSNLEEGMRRDWLLGIEGREGNFTPEFWARSPGLLETLWKVVRGDYIFGAH